MSEISEFSKLKEQQREVKKSLIMDAAEKVFASKPFHKANVREIAQAAGISPGTIYTYFQDQETLFLETSSRGAKNFIKLFKKIIKKNDPAIEEISGAYIDYIMDHIEYLRMLQLAIVYGDFNSSESLEKLKSLERELFDLTDAMFKKHTSFDDKKIRELSHLFFCSLNGILLMYGNYPDRSTSEVLPHMKKLINLMSDLVKQQGNH